MCGSARPGAWTRNGIARLGIPVRTDVLPSEAIYVFRPYCKLTNTTVHNSRSGLGH